MAPTQPELLTPNPHQIDLWFCFEDDISLDQLQNYRDQLLNAQERARELRFHFAHSRKQFLIARALVRTVLSRYAPVLPADWRFVAGPHGRPEIVQPEGAGFRFNLSHTTGLVVLAVGGQQALGVDVENTTRRPAPLEVAGHSFSSAEVSALRALPEALQAARFFHYWTLKEAYIKAKSQGLSIPLADFSMELEHAGQVSIHFNTDKETNPLGWRFFLLQASAQHVVSVCAQACGRSDGQGQPLPPLQLRMKKVQPLYAHAEENFNAVLLRETPSF
jgi:4'-phosphopantetheinyl transferase